MIRNYLNEKWKEIEIKDYYSQKTQVFISNYGRIKKKKIKEKNFKLANLSMNSRLLMFSYPRKDKHNKMFCVHKMVGICFLKKKSDDHKFVIHLDHDLLNNRVENLKFVTQKELTKHQRTNPKFIESRKKWTPKSKLTEGRVKLIKKKILDPNRRTRMRLIAKQFGISETQLRRIKNGENWNHVKI
ncbi:MAG: HNH endonuclease [Flavobacteriales bacterium]|nr:MAG: HNH endonuclease [Flavobacteriales bacterium]